MEDDEDAALEVLDVDGMDGVSDRYHDDEDDVDAESLVDASGVSISSVSPAAVSVIEEDSFRRALAGLNGVA